MEPLKGFQRKYLRGVAHPLKPTVFVGQKGETDAVVKAVDQALASHELIKVKFIDCKGKDQKTEITRHLEKKTGSEMVGMIGHVAIFYRENSDIEERKILLPNRSGDL